MIQGADALRETSFDHLPLVRRDQPGNEVEWENALRALRGIRVHRERDALMEKGAIGEIARAVHFRCGEMCRGGERDHGSAGAEQPPALTV